MGFYSNKEIAQVTEPKELTLSGNPNFITFDSVGSGNPDQKMELRIIVERLANYENGMRIDFKEGLTNSVYSFQSTRNPNKLGTNTFLVVEGSENATDRSDITSTAQNLLLCLRNNPYLRNNFEMYINPDISVGDADGEYLIDNGNIIVIKANGYGSQYNFRCELFYGDEYQENKQKPDYIDDIIKIEQIAEGSSSDSIDRGLGNTRVEIDLYRDVKSVLGDDKKEISNSGTFLTTLSKSYFGQPVWFELNALMNKKADYSTAFLNAGADWVDSGSASSFRVVARRQINGSNQVFYYSHPLYVINGYDDLLVENDLKKVSDDGTAYVMDFSQDFTEKEIVKVKPLTSMYNRTHIKGQEQYFNFIAENFSVKALPSTDFPDLALYYRMYTQSGEFISDYISHKIEIQKLTTVNTAKLDLDRFLPLAVAGSKELMVGEIEVFLCAFHKNESYNSSMPKTIISMPLTFSVFPEYLYTVNDFVFLNKWGGWDSVNFSGTDSTEFKTTATTIFKTITPQSGRFSSIETVTNKVAESQEIVQSAPMTYDGMEWLQQMSASRAVYEIRTQRYIVIDDMSLKYNRKDDLFQAEMKYHYTDLPR